MPSPMLDLRLLHNRMFRSATSSGCFSMASFLGLTFVMPLYLQLLRGHDAARQRSDDVPAGVRDHDLVARSPAALRAASARGG